MARISILGTDMNNLDPANVVPLEEISKRNRRSVVVVHAPM